MNFPVKQLLRLWALQGLLAAGWLAVLPSDSDGISAARLALIGLAAGFGLLAFAAQQNRFLSSLETFIQQHRDAIFLLSSLLTLLPPVVLVIFHVLAENTNYAVLSAYASRLLPLATFASLACAELAFGTAVRPDRLHLPPARTILLFGLPIAALAALIGLSGYGLSYIEDGSWGSPAVPLLEWQVGLATLLGIAGMICANRCANWRIRFPQAQVAGIIYLLTLILWLATPINTSFFATPPREPNHEIYPFSDALIYATNAQSLLAGEGLPRDQVPARPLYTLMLAGLIAVSGQDYVLGIALQTLLLAAFPALLYLIGWEIGGHPLGIGLAVLAALRDVTTNAVADFTLNHTYSKLYFSEIPSALFMAGALWLAIRWMNARRAVWHHALFIGGLLAVAGLIRLQSLVLLAGIGFFFLLGRFRQPGRRWLSGFLLIGLMAAITLSPWILRNINITGGVVLDNPISQTMTMARRWSGSTGNELIPRLENETDAAYSSRLTRQAIEVFFDEPGRILDTAARHMVNNQVGSLLAFPARSSLNSPQDLLMPTYPFWQGGKFNPALLLATLSLFVIGLAVAWQRASLPGLLPLGTGVLYNAWTSLFFSSGDRFLAPIDWTVWMYALLGLFFLASRLLHFTTTLRADITTWDAPRENAEKTREEPARFSVRKTGLVVALFTLIGASIPMSEALLQPVIPRASQQELIAQVGLPVEPGEQVWYGRVIYARYYEAGGGEPGTAKLGYEISPQPRLVFWLVGPQDGLVILPTEQTPPAMPNQGEIWVIGTVIDEVMYARVIKLGQTGQVVP